MQGLLSKANQSPKDSHLPTQGQSCPSCPCTPGAIQRRWQQSPVPCSKDKPQHPSRREAKLILPGAEPRGSTHTLAPCAAPLDEKREG